MKIGVRAHDYGKMPADKLFGAISADGWQAIQLAFPKAIAGIDSFPEVTAEITFETKSALDRAGLSVAVLGVYVDPSLNDETARKTQVSHLINSLPVAKMMDAGCIGTETTSRFADAGIDALYRTLEELLPEAERFSLNIGIEPVHHHILNSPELTKKMLRDFPSPRLKIIFDPINLLSLEKIDTQNELWTRCIDCFGDYIIAVHIKGALREANDAGMLTDAPFTDSIVDYNGLFSHLRNLDVPVLREGAKPSEAAADITFIRNLL